jgi:hypothetical protein
MQVICSFCGSEFSRKKSMVKENNYCTRSCYLSYSKSLRETMNCSYCDNELERYTSYVERSESGLFFCDRGCKIRFAPIHLSDDKHPLWNGGSGTYRRRALKHYGESCHNEDCDLKGTDIIIPSYMLDVHHIDSDRTNNALTNLIPLCIWCHAKTRIKSQ